MRIRQCIQNIYIMCQTLDFDIAGAGLSVPTYHPWICNQVVVMCKSRKQDFGYFARKSIFLLHFLIPRIQDCSNNRYRTLGSKISFKIIRKSYFNFLREDFFCSKSVIWQYYTASTFVFERNKNNKKNLKFFDTTQVRFKPGSRILLTGFRAKFTGSATLSLFRIPAT